MKKTGWQTISFVLYCSLGIALLGWANDGAQPIPYNHKLHIEEAGLTCEECHINVNTHARAMIPNIQLCSDCHDDPETENEQERIVAEYVTQDIQIEWKQIHIVPDHAYFSHRRHVAIAEIECADCHGDVAQMEHPFEQSYVLIDMDWCLDCHEERAIPKDCYVCHR
jgi:hypothetical protein